MESSSSIWGGRRNGVAIRESNGRDEYSFRVLMYYTLDVLNMRIPFIWHSCNKYRLLGAYFAKIKKIGLDAASIRPVARCDGELDG
jgi:hypothetical protein